MTDVIRNHSPRLAALFHLWLRGDFARHFDAVRTAGPGRSLLAPCQPVAKILRRSKADESPSTERSQSHKEEARGQTMRIDHHLEKRAPAGAAQAAGELIQLTRDGSSFAMGSYDGPVLVYTNHPSWWDPVHFMLLAHHVMPGRRLFGPFDAEALQKYRFFRRLGAFPVERNSRRGAATFLRTSRAILQEPGTSLWITAQGEFEDPRQRPVVLRPGVAHLARRLDSGVVIPLALEYPFWNERRPEALSYFGEPIPLGNDPGVSVEAWNQRLAKGLGESMDALAELTQRRDPDAFHTLLQGRTGIGGPYDAWRRLVSWSRGQRFQASHGGSPR